MNLISKLKAYLLIEQTKGKVFTASFTKKDGSFRSMNCRLGVKKGVKGVGLAYNPKDREMLCVYDMQKKAFRMLQLNTISHLKINNQEYQVG